MGVIVVKAGIDVAEGSFPGYGMGLIKYIGLSSCEGQAI
jgi:hypothetical protein